MNARFAPAAPALHLDRPHTRRRPEWGGARAGAERPERAVASASARSSMESHMTQTAPLHEPAIRDIPLCRLALAPENVRKTPPDPQADAEIKASIAAHGLLENLVARPEDNDGAYAVVAGGRRLAALKALAEDGAIGADQPVPCLIATNGNAGELSLAENVVRIAMHPADQVVAFAGLAASGATAAAIAARFGVSERTVEQRLRLGNAAPELLEVYRAGEIDLQTLMAFAVTTDHGRQRAVWEQVSRQGYRPAAWGLRGCPGQPVAGSPLCRGGGLSGQDRPGRRADAGQARGCTG